MSKAELERVKGIIKRLYAGTGVTIGDIVDTAPWLDKLVNEVEELQKENEELSESNFHFLEINQKLIEEKPMIKELTEKELNLLEEIDKLQKDSISKDIIRNFIKEELPDDEIMESCEMFDMNGVYLRKKLEELLGE